jgi:hypothetical protein
MTDPSRMHHSDEFGKPPSGVLSRSSAWSLLGRRSIGAPSSILLDEIVERESGTTPPPPPFAMKALLIGLAVMLVIGIAVLAALMAWGPAITH